jgi:HlyD family secretion protein
MAAVRPDRSGSRRRLLVATVLVVALAAVALVSRLRPASVAVVSLERRDIVETLAVVGRVRSPARAALGVSVAGEVAGVFAREGDRVAAGDVLATLDDREATATLRQAEATLAEAEARMAQSLAEAEREAVQSRRYLERVEAVVAQGGFNPQTLELAQQQADDAADRLEALRVASGPANEPAAVAAARAAVDAARARLALTRVAAPAGGVVLTRDVEPGDAVSPGRVLFELAYDGPQELVVFPGEENLARLEPGASAVASADAFPDRTFGARVSLIAPAVDASQGTIEVRMTIDDPPDYLLPGMTVSVNITTGRRPAAAVLPEAAVQGLGAGNPWVGVVRDGRLVRIDVEAGLRAEGFVEIRSGLDDDAEVVMSAGPEDVGQRVRIARTVGSGD